MEDKAFVDLKRYMELLDTEKAYRELLKEHGELTKFIFSRDPQLINEFIKLGNINKSNKNTMCDLADIIEKK